MKLELVRRDDWIVGGLALVLAIDLLLFPWFSFGLGPLGSVDFSATGAPDGWLGILAMLTALAIVADLGVERLSPSTQVPSIGNSRLTTRFILALATAGLMGLKFLFHIHFGDFGWGFWFGVILVGALVFVTMQARVAGSSAPPSPSPTSGSTV